MLQENAQLKLLNAEAEERTKKADQRQQADVHKQVGKHNAVWQLPWCQRTFCSGLRALAAYQRAQVVMAGNCSLQAAQKTFQAPRSCSRC